MNASRSEKAPASRKRRIGWLICLMAVAVLAAFYLIENWGGARAWSASQQALAAKGESLDWKALIPPPIPAEQNFFAASIVKQLIPPKGASRGTGNGSKEGAAKSFPSPPVKLFARSQPYLLGELKALPAGAVGDPTNKPSLLVLANWFDQWASQFEELRQAGMRPAARLGRDIDYADPITCPVPNFVNIRTLVQVLASRAKVNLLLGKPETALNDLETIAGIMRALDAKPRTLVSSMIRVAIGGLYATTVQEGLAERLWGDAQLGALQKDLESLDLLMGLISSLREGERAGTCHLFDTLARANPFSVAASAFENPRVAFGGGMMWRNALCPGGWIRQNQVKVANLLQGSVEGYDAKSRRFYPTRSQQAAGSRAGEFRHLTPYNFLADLFVPNFVKAKGTAAKNQALVDAAVAACALERHRQASGRYPDSLEALVPGYLAKLPHDLVTGQPLIYRRTSDGSFLLYSVGLDGKDDGGKGLGFPDDPDWVWLTKLQTPTPPGSSLTQPKKP